MKRFISLVTAVIMAVIVLVVPASAAGLNALYNGREFSALPNDMGEYTYILTLGNEVSAYGSSVPFVLHADIELVRPSADCVVKYYVHKNGSWVFSETLNATSNTNFGRPNTYIWGNVDLKYTDGSIYLSGSEPVYLYCDGSTCPATDLDHNNVCDDCGIVLTMSLRSSLWEYAQSVVANGMDIFESDYWVITDNGANGYKIYISDLPFEYISSTGNLVSNSVVQRTEVYDTSDGSYIGGTSWASKQPNTALDVGSPVATSHPIEGFFPIPLWMEMDRLTQGEMVTMGQTLGGTMKILVPCGVGLVALLAVLKLFGKRSLIFRS